MSSTPMRVQLDNVAPRHSPYAGFQRNTQRKLRADPSPRSSSSSLQSTSQSSLTGTSLKPTVSMLEEFEVEGLLGPGLSRSYSTQTIEPFGSTTSQGSSFFEQASFSTMSSSSLAHSSSSSRRGMPLSRTSTATTILEFPDGPTDPSYGTLDRSHDSLSELDCIDEQPMEDGSWVDTAYDFHEGRPTSDMTFRAPLSDGYDSDDNTDMDATITRLPLTYHDSTDTISYASSESTGASDGSLASSPEDTPRKRIWETRPDEYVPRPKGLPARSVPSVLEIGMQWEREQQGGLRSRGFSNGAIGLIRRVHGDAQYMN